MADKAQGIIVMGRDFNCVLNPYMDRLPIENKLNHIKQIQFRG